MAAWALFSKHKSQLVVNACKMEPVLQLVAEEEGVVVIQSQEDAIFTSYYQDRPAIVARDGSVINIFGKRNSFYYGDVLVDHSSLILKTDMDGYLTPEGKMGLLFTAATFAFIADKALVFSVDKLLAGAGAAEATTVTLTAKELTLAGASEIGFCPGAATSSVYFLMTAPTMKFDDHSVLSFNNSGDTGANIDARFCSREADYSGTIKSTNVEVRLESEMGVLEKNVLINAIGWDPLYFYYKQYVPPDLRMYPNPSVVGQKTQLSAAMPAAKTGGAANILQGARLTEQGNATATKPDSASENRDDADFACQIFPNPVNSTVTIKVHPSQASNVQVRIYNAVGQEAAELLDSTIPPGAHLLKWNATGKASGVYFVVVRAVQCDSGKPFVRRQKMVLLY